MEKMEEIAMDLVVAELLWGLLEVACQLAHVVDVRIRSKITFQKSIVLPYCHYGKFGSDFQCPAEVSRPRSVPSREGAATLGRLRGPGLGARWHFGGRRRHQALASDHPPRHRRTPSR